MKALILAAGYAIRLHPLTITTPKPLLTVGGVTIIDRMLEHVLTIPGVDAIHVVTNAKFYGAFDSWRSSSRHKKVIHLVNDGTRTNETRLGAITDIALAVNEGRIDDDLLVLAGDNLFEFDIRRFAGRAGTRESEVTVALYDIRDRRAASRFGVVRLERDVIVDFKEKPQDPESSLVSTGIYFFPKAKVRVVGEFLGSGEKADAPGHFISWLVSREKVYGYVFSEMWYDIGDLESLKKADEIYTKKEKKHNGNA